MHAVQFNMKHEVAKYKVLSTEVVLPQQLWNLALDLSIIQSFDSIENTIVVEVL